MLKRIIILHPSHHVYLRSIALSAAKVIDTVLGPMEVDAGFSQSLLESVPKDVRTLPATLFNVLGEETDAAEHSGEMQYPYIKLCLDEAGRGDVKLVVGMVGDWFGWDGSRRS